MSLGHQQAEISIVWGTQKFQPSKFTLLLFSNQQGSYRLRISSTAELRSNNRQRRRRQWRQRRRRYRAEIRGTPTDVYFHDVDKNAADVVVNNDAWAAAVLSTTTTTSATVKATDRNYHLNIVTQFLPFQQVHRLNTTTLSRLWRQQLLLLELIFLLLYFFLYLPLISKRFSSHS